MSGWSAACEKPTMERGESGRVSGASCVFKGCRGTFHAASGSVGVVLCSSWGFEDLAMRKSWRLLAEAVAAAGFPCLRFDYPGTGNSLGAMGEAADAGQWTRSICDAADFLRAYSGVKRCVFVGQSLGALLAAEAAAMRTDVAALLLVAPVVKGRAYLRELSVTARMATEKIGIAPGPAAGEGLDVLGFSLSRAMVDSLGRLDLTKGEPGALDHVAVYDRADRKQGAEVSEHYRRHGVAARLETIAPYHLMVSDATEIQPLPVTGGQVVATLLELCPTVPDATPPRVPLLPVTLRGGAFREEPVTFGGGEGMRGTLCRPEQGEASRLAVIFLNRGLNAQIGWRRMSVDHARGLAARGVASLRIDFAGLGDSPDAADRPVPLIYSDLLLRDVRAAVDAMAARGFARVALVGVCSGAYTALSAAAADTRVTEVVAVNTQRLVWNPAESVDDVVRYGLRTMHDYVGDLRSRGMLRKLIRSRKRVGPALWFLLKRKGADWVKRRVPTGLQATLLRDGMAARVTGLFAALSARGARVALVYSHGDPGLYELEAYFGPGGRSLQWKGTSVTIIPGADHNLTTTHAADWLLDYLLAFAADASSGEAAAQAAPALPPRVVAEP